jgi:hypothetical protein
MTLTTTRRSSQHSEPFSVYFLGAGNDVGEFGTRLLRDSKVQILTAGGIEYIFSEIGPMGDCRVDGEPFHLYTNTSYLRMRPGDLHSRSVSGRIAAARTRDGQVADAGVAFRQGLGTRVTNTRLQLSPADAAGKYMFANCFTTAPVEHLWRDGQQIF